MKLPANRLVPLAAFGVFAFLLFRPAYIARLRARARAENPQGWASVSTNGRFSLLVPELTAQRYRDESLYAARVGQILIHGDPRNPYWRDDRGAVNWIKDCIPFYLMAAVGLVFRGDLSLTWIFSTALIGALWFLTYHAVFKWWSGSEAVAMPLALFSVLFPDFYIWLLDLNFDPKVALERWSSVFFHADATPLPYSYRLPFNFLSFLLLSWLLLAAWRLASVVEKKPARSILLGLGFGALILVHPFEFVYGMATLAVFTLALRLLDRPAASRENFAAACAASLVPPAAFAALLLTTVDARTRKDSAEMVGLVWTHRFILTSGVHLLAAWFGWSRSRAETDERRRAAWLLLACAQVAAFLCRNLQVVLGFHLSPFHYITLGSFTGGVMLFLWLADVLAFKPWWNARLATAVAAALALLALTNEKSSAEKTYTMFGLPSGLESALDWAGRALPTDALVLTLSMETTKVLPLRTRAKLQVPPGDGNVSGLFTREKYFESVARLLKTAHADAGRFLSERWPLSAARRELQRRLMREQNELGKAAEGDSLEAAEWFFPALDSSDETVLAARRRVQDLVRTVPPVAGPFYLWVNANDDRLLLADPESFGGSPVYRGGGVRVYSFPYGVTSASIGRGRGNRSGGR